MKVVCLASGGIDSSVLMMMLQKMKYEIYPLHIDYGQNAAKMELMSVRKICKFLRIRPVVIKIPQIGEISSGITSQSKLTMENPFFPARNLLFLSIATAYAISKSVVTISIGSTANAIFPDQHKKFIRKAEELLNIALGTRIKILTPLIELNKREIVGLAKKYNFPLSFTYSCHLGKHKPCLRCINCKERETAISLEYDGNKY